MKKKRINSKNIQELPEIDIIDLDQEPLEKLSACNSDLSGLPPEPESEIPINDMIPGQENEITADNMFPEQNDVTTADNTFPEQDDDIIIEDLASFPEADNSLEDYVPLPDQEISGQETSAPVSAAPVPDDSDDTDISYLKQDDSWISDDWEVDGDEEDDAAAPEEDDGPDEKGRKGRFSKVNLHIIFAVILVLIVGLIGFRIWNYGVQKNLSDYEGKDEEECFDSIMPLIPKDGAPEAVDDGVTTILAFGNAPFADDRNSNDNLASMIADLSGATVYNCSVEGSYLAAQEPTLKPEQYPMDAFNFYWLTTLFCLRNNEHVYQQVFDVMGDDIPDGAKEAFDTLTTIDFDTVDVITLMYDGSDYLAGHNMYSDDNATDIQQFTGNMEAGIELIQQTYPNIRIIVMSPAYAYAVDEDGNYVSSDMYRYNNQDVLSTYVIKQYGSAYTRAVSFIDHLYGTITEANADQYLTDNIHLNLEGRKLVAQRFVDALKMYTK